MEYLILFLMCCACSNFVLKISCWKHFWPIIFIALLCGSFLWFIHPYCITQSKTQMADFLHNTKHMLNMSVFITLEATAGIAYCFWTIVGTGQKKWQKWIYAALHFFTGFLFFVVLFYVETQLIFRFPGISFEKTALITAAVVTLLIPALWWLIRKGLPETSMRLELYFFGNLLLIFLGIICTVNGQTAVSGVVQTDWKGLLYTMSLLSLVAGIGFIKYKIYHVKKNKV